MPRKMIGTLILDNSDSVHISILPLFLDKSCTMATSKHRGPSYLGNYIHIVAFALVSNPQSPVSAVPVNQYCIS